MERDYNRNRKRSQPEFLLQKHIKDGTVALEYVMLINGILALLFLFGGALILGISFNLSYIAGIWLLWGIVGGMLSGKLRKNKNRNIYTVVTLVPTVCVEVTALLMSGIYWLYSKIFHKNHN